MSSLSPNNDARRMSPRKSAGQMPHYLARGSNKQKGVKRAKKLGVGLNKWAAAEESESLASSNDDSDSITVKGNYSWLNEWWDKVSRSFKGGKSGEREEIK